MKKLPLLLISVLMLATAASGQIVSNGNSSGGGGGGGITNSGIGGSVASTLGTDTWVNALNYGAKNDGKSFVNGAMDNNVTANLTDSTNNPFVAGDVGKLICVDGAGAAGVEACGTITSFTSSSVVVLSFQNTSGGAISSKEYAYGTDNLSAVNSAITALGNGGTLFFPQGIYAMSDGVSIPTTVPLNIQGVSGSRGRNGAAAAAIQVQKPGTVLWYLTKSMTKAGLSYKSTSGNNTNGGRYIVRDLGLFAGAGGAHFDGGGASIDGIDVLNWFGLRIDNLIISGFGRYGILMDTLAGTSSDYVDQITVNNSIISGNTDGIRVGTTASGSAFIQNINVTDSELQLNNNFGFVNVWPIHTLNMTNNVIQRNDVANTTSFADLRFSNDCLGCSIAGNYFESDQANEKMLQVSNTTVVVNGPQIIGNEFVGVNGPTVILLGDATFAAQNFTILGNDMSGASGCYNVVKITNVQRIGNRCNGAGIDGIASSNGNWSISGGNIVTSAGGTLPTVTTCGTGTVTAGSTNYAGEFTSTGATACTLTFSASGAFTNAPTCVVSDKTTTGGAKISTGPSTASFTVTVTSNDVVSYVCIGH